MVESNVMLCAKGVVVDANSNNVSVFSILEQIGSPGFPLFVQEFAVLIVFKRGAQDPDQIDCELRITNNDVELARMPIRVEFAGKLANRTIVSIGGLTLPNPGFLKVDALYEGKELNSYQIEVNKIEEPKIAIKSS